MDASRGVVVRSYRDVVDTIERRIYRVDRWRLPAPHGVPVRALSYSAAALAVILVASRLPLLGELLSALPASLRYLGLPALAGWALATLALDGRPPHHVLVSAALFTWRPRTLSGRRRTPAAGSTESPVEAIQLAPAGDESWYRAGRVRGPATIALRYPAEVTVAGGLTSAGLMERARRLQVRGLEGRPLVRGSLIEVPDGARVEFN